ncbi:MAG: DNA-binding response regulator [Ignavibacteriae bacterium HGW-Ignavibacteriae-3]|nr:MAG: DNA-binding response regulator [Ignavibacteriae bacterium HGW-Ignavibacteriae-3]
MENNPYKGKKILLVEDEETLAVGLEYNLTDEGYIVDWAKDGRKALEYYEANDYDLIILDIMLPYFNGFEIAKRVRGKSPQMPLLMLTARTNAEDKVRGLEIGADDYLTKPFNLQELLLRVRGMLKRKMWYQSSSLGEPTYSFGDNTINFENLSCTNGVKKFVLTQREAMVLKYLIEKKGKIVSRKELLENVWHLSSEIETRTIDNFISRLRKYFEPDPERPVYFKSVRSAGYKFDDETENNLPRSL